MNRHKSFLRLLAVLLLVVGVMIGRGALKRRSADREGFLGNREVAEVLLLTDLAFFTEARYTRHPSQADYFSAFQSFPGALDYFPAGSIIGPTRLLGQLEKK
jgi:hypothetical protein